MNRQEAATVESASAAVATTGVLQATWDDEGAFLCP